MRELSQIVLLSAMPSVVAFSVFLGACTIGQSTGEKEKQTGVSVVDAVVSDSLSEPRDSNAEESARDASIEPASRIIPEGMLLVPGGEFTMGLNNSSAIPDERFEHAVTVASFLFDITEVTNESYDRCVDAGKCRKPAYRDTVSAGFAPYEIFRSPTRPVSAVSQKDASDFCAWMKKRLPTEAEFERAARGTDGRLYCWGNREPNPQLAVFGGKSTLPVGSKPAGAGPFGHLDLAGNVWEWTSDRYDPLAYERPGANRGIPADCDTIISTQNQLRKEGKQGYTGSNPIPTECEYVLRGGAFNYFSWGLRASNRVHHPGSWRMIMAGFRCAASWPKGLSD